LRSKRGWHLYFLRFVVPAAVQIVFAAEIEVAAV